MKAAICLALFGMWMFQPVCAESGPGRANAGEKRVALVIGNKDYRDEGWPALRNPINDAHDMKEALEGLGFKVVYQENADYAQMNAAMREFARLLPGGVGVFYFAGHGTQVDNANYLIPVGASIHSKTEVKSRAYPAADTLGNMEEAGAKVSIIILDACRRVDFRGYRSQAEGLAQMSGGGSGSIIAFATAPGDTTEDGAGRNGTFTKHLLRQMAEPGVTALHALERVQVAVADETKDAQKPWIDHGPFRGQFCFAGCGEEPSRSGPLSVAASKREPEPPEPARPTEQLISGHYRDHGDGTVTDTQTGLQWMRCDLGQTWDRESCAGKHEGLTFDGAAEAATALNRSGGYAGYRDWRVPTKEELESLVKKGVSPSIDGTAFPDTPPKWHWSSSLYASYSSAAWIVFDNGYSYRYGRRNSKGAVRLVRWGQ